MKGLFATIILTTHCLFASTGLDLAFNLHDLNDAIAVSPDGQFVAYSVQKKPEDINYTEVYLENGGTPSMMAGSHLFLSHKGLAQMIGPANGNSWRPVLSPDGKKIAFYCDATGIPTLWVYEIGGEAKQVSNEPIRSSVFSFVDRPQWSPDSNTIYLPLSPTRKLPLSVETFMRCSLGAIDVASGKSHSVVSEDAFPAPAVPYLSPSGKWLAYLSVPSILKDPSIGISDLAVIETGQKAEVRTVDTGLATSTSAPNCIAWHPTKDLLVYVKDKRLFLLDLEKGTPPQQLSDEAVIAQPLFFAGERIIIGLNPFRDGYRDKPREILLISQDGKESSTFLLDGFTYLDAIKGKADGTLLLRLEEANGSTVIARYDLQTKGKEILWKEKGRMSGFTASNEHIYFLYEDFATPPNLYRTDENFSSFERITNIEPLLDSLGGCSCEIFDSIVPFYNGTLKKVHTAIILPKGAKQGDKLAGIVEVYPGADISRRAGQFCGGDVATIPAFLFLERGYALIFPTLTMGPEGEKGNPVQETVDILLPQLYKAAELGYIDIERIGIIGQSFGGYGTAAAITRTNLFRAAVAISGLYDLPGNYGHMDKYDSGFSQKWLEYGQARMGAPLWDNPLRFLENSPYFAADKIHTPLLILHGENDETCPVEEARKLYVALKRLGSEVQLGVYPGEGHVIYGWKRPEAVKAAKQTLDFFDLFLKK